MAHFEKRAATNSKKGGWIWGNKVCYSTIINILVAILSIAPIPQLTYADFATYLLYDYVVANIPEAGTQYPSLSRLKKNVENLPKIANWIERRPDTPL